MVTWFIEHTHWRGGGRNHDHYLPSTLLKFAPGGVTGGVRPACTMANRGILCEKVGG